MIPDFVMFPLDVLHASQLAGADQPHRNVKVIAGGFATCDRCRRLLTAEEWASPCSGSDEEA